MSETPITAAEVVASWERLRERDRRLRSASDRIINPPLTTWPGQIESLVRASMACLWVLDPLPAYPWVWPEEPEEDAP